MWRTNPFFRFYHKFERVSDNAAKCAAVILENDATEKLGGLGRHYLHSFRGHPRKSFVLSTSKPARMGKCSLEEGMAFYGQVVIRDLSLNLTENYAYD